MELGEMFWQLFERVVGVILVMTMTACACVGIGRIWP